MDAKIATVKYRPSLASAKKPPRRPRRLRVPMKLVTMVADFADEICSSPTRYVTKFMDMPMTHILSESSVPAKQIKVEIYKVLQYMYLVTHMLLLMRSTQNEPRSKPSSSSGLVHRISSKVHCRISVCTIFPTVACC